MLVGLHRGTAGDHPDRTVQQEIGRNHADPPIVCHPPGLSVERQRIGVDAVGESFGVFGGVHHMAAGEEVGGFDESAADLVHDIGRVAIAQVVVEVDDVAERKAIAFVGDLVRRSRHRRIERVRSPKLAEVQLLQHRQTRPGVGCKARTSLRRTVRQPMLERRPRTLVDAEAGRILGIFGEDLLGHAGKQIGGGRQPGRKDGRKRRQCSPRRAGNQPGRCRPAEKFASSEPIHARSLTLSGRV